MTNNQELAEQQLVYEVFSNNPALEEVFPVLSEADFGNAAYKEIYRRARQEWQGEGSFNAAALLENEDFLKVFLAVSNGYLLPAQDLLPFAERIKTQAKARRLKAGLQKIQLAEPEEVLAQMERLLEQEQGNLLRDYGKLVESQIEQVLEEMTSDGQKERIFTGLQGIDHATGGLRQGNVSTWGAKPSTGKTALLLNILLKNAKAGKKCLFFSLEMSAGQLWERLVANAASVNYSHINKHTFDPEEAGRFRDGLLRLYRLNTIFLIDDAAKLEQQLGILFDLKPDFVVVDYIQLVRSSEACGNRHDEISRIMAAFKAAARKLNCHIALLSQFNRGVSNQATSMFGLKESSSIEDGSDYIVLLSRPAVENPERPPEETEIKLAKNKFGRPGVGQLYFDGKYQRFCDVETSRGMPWPERVERRG